MFTVMANHHRVIQTEDIRSKRWFKKVHLLFDPMKDPVLPTNTLKQKNFYSTRVLPSKLESSWLVVDVNQMFDQGTLRHDLSFVNEKLRIGDKK